MGDSMARIGALGAGAPATITTILYQVALDGLLQRLTPRDGPVLAHDAVLAELVGKIGGRLLGAGEYHQPAGVLVDAVDRPQFGKRSLRATGKLAAQQIQQGGGKEAAGPFPELRRLARAPLGGEPGRLAHHHDLVVQILDDNVPLAADGLCRLIFGGAPPGGCPGGFGPGMAPRLARGRQKVPLTGSDPPGGVHHRHAIDRQSARSDQIQGIPWP